MKTAYIETLEWKVTEYNHTLKQHSTYTFRMCPHCNSDKMFSKYIIEQKENGENVETTAFGLPKNALWVCETCANVIYEDDTQAIFDEAKDFTCPKCGWHIYKEYRMRHGNNGKYNMLYHCCERCYTKFLITDGELPNKQSMNQFEIIKPLKCPRCSEQTLVKESSFYECKHCEIKLDFDVNKKPILPLYCEACGKFSVLKRKSFRYEELDGVNTKIEYTLTQCATCNAKYNEEMKLVDYYNNVIKQDDKISSEITLKISSSVDNTLTM